MNTQREELKDSLQQLVEHHGQALCVDQRKIMRLLLESGAQRGPEVLALHAAVREGVAADLALQVGAELSGIFLDRYAQRIFDRTGISMELNTWAVETWAAALGRAAEARHQRLKLKPVMEKPRRRAPAISKPKDIIYPLDGHRKALTDITFSPSGRWVATGSIDRTVRIWDGSGGRQKAILYGGHRDWVRSLAYRPDGQRMASVGDDGGARIWNMTTGKRMHRLIGHNDWSRSVVYGHEGRLLFTGGRDGTVCIWEAESAELAAKIGPLPGEITSIAVDKKGRWLAMACSNRLELWDIGTQDRRRFFSAEGERVTVGCHFDGSLLLGDETGLRKIDPNSGESQMRFFGHKGLVHSLAVDPAGASLVTAGVDQTVRVWDLEDAELRWTFDLRRTVTGVDVNKAGTIAVAFGDGKGVLFEMARGG